MARLSHLLRREVIHYWRRTTPGAHVQFRKRSRIVLNLRTWTPAHARQIALQLDAFLGDLRREG